MIKAKSSTAISMAIGLPKGGAAVADCVGWPVAFMGVGLAASVGVAVGRMSSGSAGLSTTSFVAGPSR